MTRALTLYRKHTQAQLVAMQTQLSDDPASRNTDGGIHLYTPKVRRELDAIAGAITYHLDDSRAAAGRPVPTSGYSGRNSRRR